jgi:hypothetical protein
MLRNRFRSEVNHSDRPAKWIASLSSYRSGPIDKFGHPKPQGKQTYPDGFFDAPKEAYVKN